MLLGVTYSTQSTSSSRFSCVPAYSHRTHHLSSSSSSSSPSAEQVMMQSTTWDAGRGSGTSYHQYPVMQQPYRFTSTSSPMTLGALPDVDTDRSLTRQAFPETYGVPDLDMFHPFPTHVYHHSSQSTGVTVVSDGQYGAFPVAAHRPSTRCWNDRFRDRRPPDDDELNSALMPTTAEVPRSHPDQPERLQIMSHPQNEPFHQQVVNFGASRSTTAEKALDDDRYAAALSPRSVADVFGYGDYSSFARRSDTTPASSSSPPSMVLTPCDGKRTNQSANFAPTNVDFTPNDTRRHLLSPSFGWSHVVDAPEYHTQRHEGVSWPQPPATSYVRYPVSSAGGRNAASVSVASCALSRREHEDAFLDGFQSAAAADSDQRTSLQQWTSTNDRDDLLVPVKVTPSTSIGKTRTRDKYRTVYTEPQRVELETEFQRSTYISAQRKADIATMVGLSERQVKIWFQNRRAKDRRQDRKRRDARNGNTSAKTATADSCSPTGNGTESSTSTPSSSSPPSCSTAFGATAVESKRRFVYFASSSPGGDTSSNGLFNTLRLPSDGDRLPHYVM